MIVQFKITYDTDELRKEAIQRILKEQPRDSSVFSTEGAYNIRMIGAKQPWTAQNATTLRPMFSNREITSKDLWSNADDSARFARRGSRPMNAPSSILLRRIRRRRNEDWTWKDGVPWLWITSWERKILFLSNPRPLPDMERKALSLERITSGIKSEDQKDQRRGRRRLWRLTRQKLSIRHG